MHAKGAAVGEMNGGSSGVDATRGIRLWKWDSSESR